MFETNVFKTGRKITDLEFIFDYKNNDKRIMRGIKIKITYNKTLLEILESYIGKKVFIKNYGEFICEHKELGLNNAKCICFLQTAFKR